jgi:hypothetical protein
MHIYLKEKIGNPDLFTGRKKELTYFETWISKIKKELSKSTAVLSRRKTGKTALLQRLYNLTFEKNDGVIPFYYEVKEGNQWALDFSLDFYLTFMYQYIGFKTRKAKYVELSQQPRKTFTDAKSAAREVGEYLFDEIESMERFVQEGRVGALWAAVRETPWTFAARRDESVVQMIDEFQFLNRYIYWDEAKTNHADDFAAGYLSTAEYKNAPLLITGSWVGWLMDDLSKMLPGRFVLKPLHPMPEEEAVEMIYKYSLIEDIPVSDETVYLIAQLTEGNPFYMSALFYSTFEDKDLTTEEGVRKTLEYETLNLNGSINATWMEYVDSAFPRINEVYAKDIVLYLSKHRHQRVSRKELKEKLGLNMTDSELEKKFRALFRSDIIEEDYGSYRGVQDNIFDKVFRRSYADDIDKFVTEEAPNEYKVLFKELQKKYKTLSGDYNRYKGAFAEFVICHHLRYSAFRHNDLFRSLMQNLPEDFRFSEYENVWSYSSPPLFQPEFQIDLFARAKQGEYSLIGEVKNREKPFLLKEAEAFLEKAQVLMRLEQVQQAVLFVFSAAGFYDNTFEYLQTNNIAWSDDPRWLDNHFLKDRE